MRFGEVKNRPVVSVAGAEKLGFIDDLLLDTAAHQVVGFRVRQGGLITHREALLLHDSMTGNRVIGSRVMTENGANLGNVSDIDADFATGQVLGYALVSGLMDRLRRQDEMVPVAAVKSIGDNLVVVGNEFTPAP
jgi:uncharacterized protein YrrD